MVRPQKRVKRTHEPTKPAPRCYLLEIPIEIRLMVYECALAETNHITISVAELEKNVFDHSEPEETIEGIPGRFVPLIKNKFDPKMMEIGKVEVIPLPELMSTRMLTGSMDSGYGSFNASNSVIGEKFGSPHRPELSSMSLLLTNRQIHDEMTAHIKHPTSARSTLHVNYPYGIIVLETLYPSLLRHAKEICISGWYDSTSEGALFGSPHRGPSGLCLTETPESVYKIANSALTRLVRTTLPQVEHPTLKSLKLRIYYPREDHHSVIWTCKQSPIPIALRDMCGGKVDMKVLRGECGNGLVLNVEPDCTGRNLTTVWRKFHGNKDKEREAWKQFGNDKFWGGGGVPKPADGAGTWTIS